VVKSFCKYYFLRQRLSSIDNLLVKELNANVFSKIGTINDFEIQKLVSSLKNDRSTIKISDFGAGSKRSKSNERSIKSIVKNASINPKFGKLLNLIISYYNCNTIIELGTSLGIGTSYLALSNNQSVIYTIEGCENISHRAQINLNSLTNIKFYVGEFSQILPQVFKCSGNADLVYIDGNHTHKATLDYFNYLLTKVNTKAILVFDDIHWSHGMELAWQDIITSSSSRITIDLFRMGIVFLDPDLKKEHFIIQF
jgi:predicted O-methyltransferase YrrM